MNSKNISKAAREHLFRVKSVACSVCDAPPPSTAHHIRQGDHFTTVALCPDCHQGAFNGIHGQQRIWRVRKLDELSALNITIQRVQEMEGWGR